LTDNWRRKGELPGQRFPHKPSAISSILLPSTNPARWRGNAIQNRTVPVSKQLGSRHEEVDRLCFRLNLNLPVTAGPFFIGPEVVVKANLAETPTIVSRCTPRTEIGAGVSYRSASVSQPQFTAGLRIGATTSRLGATMLQYSKSCTEIDRDPKTQPRPADC
jgi:hypothetical protein